MSMNISMKILASFDSADSADFAAGALKNAVSPLSSIEVKNNSHNDKISMNIFSSFNPVVTTPTYSMPVYNPFAFENKTDSRQKDYLKNEFILEIICSKEDYHTVSRIITNHGGRNISKL